ncbi:MAG: DUF3572 domain-containing protein [Salaquimonas sp.]
MPRRLSEENARDIAIAGLGFIAADEDEMGRFLNLTGMAAEDLRKAAANPGFLIGVLDFFMGFEPTLLRFAEDKKISPQDIVDARQILAGPEEAW